MNDAAPQLTSARETRAARGRRRSASKNILPDAPVVAPAEPPSESVKERSKLTKEEWREYTKTVWQIANTTHSGHPAVFPPEIPHRLIKLFSFVEETVLDPFGGTGTTAAVALELGRRSVCVEQNPTYVEHIRKATREAGGERPSWNTIVQGDSRSLKLLDDSVGVIVTSPPYWNKANYGDGAANLGNVAGYRAFFEEVRPVFEECYRVLKPGRKLCVVTANVNQHTDHGLLTFPLAADFTVLLRDIGFVMVNELIWSKDGTGGRWGSWGEQRPIFGSYPYPPNFLFKNVHEYILVFAKPPERPVRGPKVQSYESLMRRPETPSAK